MAKKAKKKAAKRTSKPALSALFRVYDGADQRVTAAEKERTKALETIRKHYRGGPFEWKGRVLALRKRGDVLFFAGVGRKVQKAG